MEKQFKIVQRQLQYQRLSLKHLHRLVIGGSIAIDGAEAQFRRNLRLQIQKPLIQSLDMADGVSERNPLMCVYVVDDGKGNFVEPEFVPLVGEDRDGAESPTIKIFF